jgi:tRNA threonylcarbamoyladenosine biosynthesis protein TsaB
MLVAALDTGTLTLSCALVDVGAGGAVTLRSERIEHAPARKRATGQQDPGAPRPDRPTGGHSASLPSALVSLLAAEGLAIPDVEGYAVGLGPGSFTGLRIGLATWKGLAYANRRPIVGTSSLAAMALAASADAPEGAVLVPLLDAKKGEVYAGFFRATGGGVVELADEAALPPAAMLERIAGLAGRDRAAAFGEGYETYADVLSPALPRLDTAVRTPPALQIAILAAAELAVQPFDVQALFALEPHYVRPSEAELKHPRGLGGGPTGRH